MEAVTSEKILDQFLERVKESKIELYPAQEEAILELYSGKNVILNTPTGSGKSMVAAALHFYSLARGRRSIYTCPIKALVNEKFLQLCREFGPEKVGMVTGDATVNPEAPIICCTAEILANRALRLGSNAPIHDVIMDEFHYYSDKDRGIAWQIPLLTLNHCRFLLMSATLGDTTFFEKSLTDLNGLETVLVSASERPVPLQFEYSEVPLYEKVSKLIDSGRAPVYIVNFSQRECAEEAQNFLSIDFNTKEEKRAIAAAIEDVKFSSPYGKEIQKLIKHGIGIHHAGLLPKYRVLVEKLAQKGLLKIICGTDTLGVGVNVPIRTVVFTKLCKFDGEKTAILSTRDFLQIAGRAGRKGYDHEGFVVVQAPEHVIENIRQEQKAAGDPKKLKKLVKKKPPEKGFVNWNKETFTKLVNGKAEALTSRFKVSHGMLLNVLSRKDEDGCNAMRDLIRNSHESDYSKRQHGKVAFQLFRSLVDRKLIELNPLRINVELQEDFSLNQTLSLYLLDTLQVLEKDDLDFHLNILTLVESILENPEVILNKQLDLIKTEKMNELKMQGMEFDDRINELEKLEYPKPMRDFIYATFNEFSRLHPWVGQENIRPKSIAREMFEKYMSFAEYVREYSLQRAEGIFLRYLSDVYKVLVQTVPDSYKNDQVEEIIVYLGSIVRQVDSSLIDEWEKMKDPNWAKNKLSKESEDKLNESPRPGHLTTNTKKFSILVRNEIFRFIRALSANDFEEALAIIPSDTREVETPWTKDSLQARIEEYYSDDHARICTDAKARDPKLTKIESESKNGFWKVQQTLVDPEGLNDWGIDFLVDVNLSNQENRPVLSIVSITSF